MGLGVDILDIGKVKEKLRSYLQEAIEKGGDALAEIECEDYRDSFVVMLVLREMHLELLSKKITPIIKLQNPVNQIAEALEAAMVMKAFALATEKLQKFHPKIKLADLRSALTEEALDSFRGRTKEDIAEELKKAFPEVQLLFK